MAEPFPYTAQYLSMPLYLHVEHWAFFWHISPGFEILNFVKKEMSSRIVIMYCIDFDLKHLNPFRKKKYLYFDFKKVVKNYIVYFHFF